MRRFHLFELEDQAWFPAIIRDAGSCYLEFAARISGHAANMAPLLQKALDRAGEDRIVDLCSGGSGPLPTAVAEIAAQTDRKIEVTLTDLYPNRDAFERTTEDNPGFTAVFDSVDATDVPKDLTGLRTLFSGFHHFRPQLAKSILASAVRDRSPIAVFELVARHPFAIAAMFAVPFMTLFTVPLLRPFRWAWIPLTYLVPVIPFFIFWDGFVSCLRCYTPDELREMTADLTTDDYEWEVGSIDLVGVPFKGSYLIGAPKKSVPRSTEAGR